MRLDYVTPHQSTDLKRFVDTLILAWPSPYSLDIAAPHGATRFIAAEIAERVHNRFPGRMVQLSDTSGWLGGPSEADLDAVSTGSPIEAKYGILLTDRHQVSAWNTVQVPSGTLWVCFDWWQWLRARVDTQRLVDAWTYLCYGAAQYLQCSERRTLGLDDPTVRAMMQEGNRLLNRLADVVVEKVLSIWQ